MNAPTAIAGASTTSTVAKALHRSRAMRGARCRNDRRPGHVEKFTARTTRLDRLAPGGSLFALLRMAGA
ncbi:MAG: hypothetical protein ACRC2B_12435 [Rubrivivax sp.]